jgi:competence protein ComEA
MANDDSKPEFSVWPRAVLRSGDQIAAASVTAAALAIILGWCLWRESLGGRLIDIEQAEPVAIGFFIDVNRADWPELALLPNIGEQLAKRIVADRAENGAFRELTDLQRVRGIGPRTLESIEPYLLPLTELEATAAAQAAARAGAAP